MKKLLLLPILLLAACSRYHNGQVVYIINGCQEVVVDTSITENLYTVTNHAGQRWENYEAELVPSKAQCWPTETAKLPPDPPEWVTKPSNN